MLNLEEQLRLARIKNEAAQLNAEELRMVLQATWNLWLHERKLLTETLAAEGIAMNCEVQGAFPLELARRQRPEAACLP